MSVLELETINLPLAECIVHVKEKSDVGKLSPQVEDNDLRLKWDGRLVDGWMRIAWRCDDIAGLLAAINANDARQLRVDFKRIAANAGNVAWIALMGEKSDGSMAIVKRLWTANEKGSPPPAVVQAEVHHTPMPDHGGTRLFEVVMHLERVTDDIVLGGDIRIDLLRAEGLNVTSENHKCVTISSKIPEKNDFILQECEIQVKDKSDVRKIMPNPAGEFFRFEWDGRQVREWIRLAWCCNDIGGLLAAIPRHSVHRLRVDFGSLTAAPGNIAWIALMGEDSDGSMSPVKRLWLADGSGSPPPPVLEVDVRHLPCPEGETGPRRFELDIHLERVTDDIVVGSNIRMELLPAAGIYVTRATYDDFEVRVEGLGRDVQRLGMPVRVQLEFAGEVRDERWARTVTTGRSAGDCGQYAFSLAAYAHPDQVADGVRVVLSETGEAVTVIPTTGDAGSEVADAKGREEPPPRADEEVFGRVERFDRRHVVGWAICRERPEAPLDLALYADGRPLFVVRPDTLRTDVSDVHGGHGRCGFTFEIPYGLAVAEVAHCEVRPVTGRNAIKANAFKLKPLGLVFPNPNPRRAESFQPTLSSPVEPISLVVLNRNGGALLNELFASALEHEPPELLEWIVVDHGSTDNTVAVCEEAARWGQRIRLLCRDANFSFSNSCNFGVRHASHDVVVLANNDLIFHGPVVRRVRAALADPGVGVVGARLIDHSDTAPEAVRSLKVVQHLGVHVQPRAVGPWIRMFDGRLTPDSIYRDDQIVEAPAVTGAFLAMRATDYTAVGGLDEEYQYGLEDIALCLAVRFRLDLKIVCDNTLSIGHHRGYTRAPEINTAVRQRNNNDRLNRSWGAELRSAIKHDLLRKPGFWQGTWPVVAFAVADAGDSTTAGEYYTALELGRALQRLRPVHLRFVTREQWHDLREIDLIVAMVADFSLHKVQQASPFLRTVNWTRQWFDKWARDETLASYDHVLASSRLAAEFLGNVLDRPLPVMPIATDPASLSVGRRRPEYVCDYCITGNRVGTVRELEFNLDPDAINGIGAIYGSGWEGTALEPIARGPVPYSEIPDVYASTRIVVDDANIATKRFGSCNSRVFDSMAAGCLLVTNGAEGVKDLFGDLVPTYSDREELTETINYWLENEKMRQERVEQLREIVHREHTYENRAMQLLSLLEGGPDRPRVAIKCAAPYAERDRWGDHYFARSLAAALRRLGFTVRVDYRESWECGLAQSDDAVIVLRGLLAYKPKPHQVSYNWIISHPGAVTLDELAPFDRIYAASSSHSETLERLMGRSVEMLPQCTDASFLWDGEGPVSDRPFVFVGNSRGVHRPVVRWSIEAGHEVDVYGGGWEQFLSPEYLKGEYVPNAMLPLVYRRARAVLCDHYEDMRRLGYVSNRAYDVLAAGGLLLTDEVDGIRAALPEGGYRVYADRDELDRLLCEDFSADAVQRRAQVQWVAANHTFDQRAATLAAALRADLKLPEERAADGRAA